MTTPDEPNRYRYAQLVPGVKIAVFVERGTTIDTIASVPPELIAIFVSLLAREAIRDMETAE